VLRSDRRGVTNCPLAERQPTRRLRSTYNTMAHAVRADGSHISPQRMPVVPCAGPVASQCHTSELPSVVMLGIVFPLMFLTLSRGMARNLRALPRRESVSVEGEPALSPGALKGLAPTNRVEVQYLRGMIDAQLAIHGARCSNVGTRQS
jgi:hypothetical protein